MSRVKAILSALLAAAFFAVNVPVSKLLLRDVGPAMMAALLYLGAGIGIGILSLFRREDRGRSRPLTKGDLPFVAGMIALDIAAPILLMLGIRAGSSSSASLLGNFEIAATAVIALLIFHEAVSRRLWAAIGLITLSSALLSFEGADSLRFSAGSLLVLLAAVCWGFENNCTRMISSKSTYEIVTLKGLFSGSGSLAIALARGGGPAHPARRRGGPAAGLCGLRAEHLPLCPGPERAGCRQNQRLLRRRPLYRRVSLLRAPPGAAVPPVPGRAGGHGGGGGAGGGGHPGPQPCPSSPAHLYPHPRRLHPRPHRDPCPPPQPLPHGRAARPPAYPGSAGGGAGGGPRLSAAGHFPLNPAGSGMIPNHLEPGVVRP